MRLRGIRGATSVSKNDQDEILAETKKLMQALIEKNSILRENVVSVIFTSTPDLTAEFPAKACREMGWTDVPLLGCVEADVPHGVKKCIRVLVHAYLEDNVIVKPVYRNEAMRLRPDLPG